MNGSPPLPLHRNRDYRRLWAAHALSAFGSQATFIALPLVLLAATHSVTDFGIVTFVEIGSSVFLGLPAGVLVDRISHKKLLLCCDLGRACAFGLFALAVLSHQVSLPLAVLLAVLNSVLGAPFGPAASAALRGVVPPSQLAGALSYSQARAATVTLAGPLVGAALYTVTPVLPFIVDGLSYLASAACVATVRLPARGPDPSRTAATPHFLRDLTTGVHEVRRSAFLGYTLVNAAVVNFAFHGIFLVLIAQGAAGDDGSAFHNGAIIAISGVGNLVGSLCAAWAGRVFSPRALVLVIGWTTAGLVPLLPLSGNVAFTGLIIGLCGLTAPAANVVISAARLRSIPEHLQGRVQTACDLIPALIVPFGPLTAGALLDRLPADTVLLLYGAVLALLAVFSSASKGLRRIPDLRETSVPEPHPVRVQPETHP
ncbi:MFS transporter [Streptomyces sp. SLBN-118]|uniref:MFS transporter n=1 Tax=Streptomyces sp. SLBN-118 TaxID=2768454 RepID=UPI00116D2B2D|nr:MFS transporter [Streptomyces sp. SLBN-118]TQK44330.1 MFS transporter [Streptomyces sp. SLBN-118]